MNERTDQTEMQQHPLARLDGDNADGNPTPLALLDELISDAERAIESIDHEVGARMGRSTYQKNRLNAIADRLESMIGKMWKLRSEIELQENHGATPDG